MKTYGKIIEAEPGNAPAGFLAPVHFPSLGKVDTRTRDGRMIVGEGFAPFELPRSIQVCTRAEGAHFGAEPAGRIDAVTVHDDGNVEGWGWMLNDAVGSRAAYLLKTKAMRGNSMDLSAADKDVDIDVEIDDDGYPTFKIDFRESRMAATTLLTTPAFDDSYAEIPEGWEIPGVEEQEAEAIVAALAFNEPDHRKAILSFNVISERPKVSADPFQDPRLDDLTPIYVDEGERVFGHVAGWHTPHLNADGMTPPRSESGYAYYANKAVLTTDGMLSTGPIVIGGDHADIKKLWRDAIDHYANTCAAWADVCIGEDEHGIWVAGIVRPGTSNELIHAGRASALSGDWRRIGGRWEFVANLSVNAPGFPTPKPRSFGHEMAFPLTMLGAGALPAPTKFASGQLANLEADPHLQFLAESLAAEKADEILDGWGDPA